MEQKYEIDIGLEEAQVDAVRDLSKELLVLRLAFGKLNAAIADAAAPIAAVLVPALSQAVYWATRTVKAIGKVLGALLGVRVSTDTVEKSIVKAGKAAQRSLAGFDQLNRLNGDSGGGTTTVSQTVPQVINDTLSPQLQAIVTKINALLEPLRNIDFTPLIERLHILGSIFQTVGQRIFAGLEWLWYQVLTPFAAWVIEQLAPAFTGVLNSALKTVVLALTPAAEGFTALWTAMQPVMSFIGGVVVDTLGLLQQAFNKVTVVLMEKGSTLRGVFESIGTAVTGLWGLISPVLNQLWSQWKLTFDNISGIVADAIGFAVDGLAGLAEFLAGVFTMDWDRAWKGICSLLKVNVNGVIGLLNAMLECSVSAFNSVIRAVNTIRFTVPDWVPLLGGRTMGFNLRTATVPQIPYLAKGAVLPANKPFLAMVGDQKHGTNVEAPLATIQEAVALVMNDQIGAMMSGFSATVRELQQLRCDVSAIEVGDTVIGAAAQRYNRKMAVVRGGQF